MYRGVVRPATGNDGGGQRHPQRVEGSHGDLQLGQIIAVLAVTELDQPLFGLDIGISGGGGGVDANEVRREVVNADGVLVEVGLEVLPGIILRQGIEEVGEAVVVEIEGADGLAEEGREGVKVLLGPRLEMAETVVTLRGDEDQPGGDHRLGRLECDLCPDRVV